MAFERRCGDVHARFDVGTDLIVIEHPVIHQDDCPAAKIALRKRQSSRDLQERRVPGAEPLSGSDPEHYDCRRACSTKPFGATFTGSCA